MVKEQHPQEEVFSHLVKAGLHLERQKFGKSGEEVTKWLEKLKVKDGSEVGLNLSEAQNKALFAIQKLLHST